MVGRRKTQTRTVIYWDYCPRSGKNRGVGVTRHRSLHSLLFLTETGLRRRIAIVSFVRSRSSVPLRFGCVCVRRSIAVSRAKRPGFEERRTVTHRSIDESLGCGDEPVCFVLVNQSRKSSSLQVVEGQNIPKHVKRINGVFGKRLFKIRPAVKPFMRASRSRTIISGRVVALWRSLVVRPRLRSKHSIPTARTSRANSSSPRRYRRQGGRTSHNPDFSRTWDGY